MMPPTQLSGNGKLPEVIVLGGFLVRKILAIVRFFQMTLQNVRADMQKGDGMVLLI